MLRINRSRQPMSVATRCGTAVLCALTLLSHQAQADVASLLELPLPESAKIELVGANMMHNGSLVSIATYQVELSSEETLNFYRNEWHLEGEVPGYVEYEAGGWKIIASLRDGINLALQLREDGYDQTSGLVSALDVDSGGSAVEQIPALPSGAEVLSTTGSQDGSREAHTWLLRSVARPGQVTAFYRDELSRQGWRVVSDADRAAASVLLLSSEKGTIEVTASPNIGGTFVVVNRVRTGS